MGGANLKQRLVGTIWGRSLHRTRDLWELWRVVRLNPESGGAICQDLCAQYVLSGLCDERKTFVDVGAHFGSMIASVRHRHPRISVIAIEADPDKAAALAKKFSDVEVHSCAVGERTGEVTFFLDGERPGYSNLAERGSDGRRPISVAMRRLDDLIADSATLEVIKIDVTGTELDVLRGSSELVSRCRPAVMFAGVPVSAEAASQTMGQLFDWFAEREYEILVPNRVAHDGPSLSRESFRESHFHPARAFDYFSIPSERRVEFRDRARVALGVKPQSFANPEG